MAYRQTDGLSVTTVSSIHVPQTGCLALRLVAYVFIHKYLTFVTFYGFVVSYLSVT